jgi:hypothetical protein
MLTARSTEPGSLAHVLDAPRRFWGAEGLQRGRKLQGLTFRYKRWAPATRIRIYHDDVEHRLRLWMAVHLTNIETRDML